MGLLGVQSDLSIQIGNLTDGEGGIGYFYSVRTSGTMVPNSGSVSGSVVHRIRYVYAYILYSVTAMYTYKYI